MAAIRVEGLVKRFGALAAVDGFSFEVREGERVGVLGPNGAGKTTLINILSTLLRPTAGRAEVAGFSVLERPDDGRRSIGVVFQEPSLDTRLTARENLALHAAVYGVPRAERRRRIAEMLEMVELQDRADSLVGTFAPALRFCRRSASTRPSRSAAVRRAIRCGRDDRSPRPASPSTRNRASHTYARRSLIPSDAAAERTVHPSVLTRSTNTSTRAATSGHSGAGPSFPSGL
jgi:ABC-type glutathione transport system ATPase component